MSPRLFLFLFSIFFALPAQAAPTSQCTPEDLVRFQSGERLLFHGEPAWRLYDAISGGRNDIDDGDVCFGSIHCEKGDTPYGEKFGCYFLVNSPGPAPTENDLQRGNILVGNSAEELLWSNFPAAWFTLYYEYPHAKDSSCELRLKTKNFSCAYTNFYSQDHNDCDRLRQIANPTYEEEITPEKFLELYVSAPLDRLREVSCDWNRD